MTFTEIIDDLLLLENDPGRLFQASRDFYGLLSQITGMNAESTHPADNAATILTGGTAISPRDAGLCVLDVERTSRFLRGLYAAVLAAKKRFPNEKIDILYAGTGPFAALALPVCAKFSAAEIAFTLMDIHARSIESVETLFETLGFSGHIDEIIQADAAIYQPPNGRRFHIIIAETMQKTLEKEPQVAITLNLSRHLRKDGIFIPEKISVDAFLADLNGEFSINGNKKSRTTRIYLGNIFELTAAKRNLAPATIEIPEGDFSGFRLLLLTRIIVFESIDLGDYSSGITYPTIFWDIDIKEKNRIKFRYKTGENPHFEYSVI